MPKQDKVSNDFHKVATSDESRPGIDRVKHRRFLTDKTQKSRLTNLLIFAFVLLAASGTVMITLARAEKGVQDPYNHTIGLRKIYYNVIKPTAPTDIRM